jgi:hypothetical protein
MDWVKQLHQCGCRLRSPNSQILLFRPATVGDADRGYLLAPVAHKQGYLHKRGRLNTAFQVRASVCVSEMHRRMANHFVTMHFFT